ncbi:hypothetical protein [Levilactobacillus andaensis]|uniref:hypothetical protein n=1 Tax=Levilactobacillus andaensis TaxID=2799570 RepID=UPI001F3C9678|nr:hypothetical protein [Levilactobacillus andaensis]
MKKIVKGIIATSVGLGLVGGTLTASASSQYSASRSNSVRLVWRRSMGKHALVATQGARYSEHLGIRYDYNSNTPDMVWYTNAHEELYDVDSGNYLIYYHVNSADGQHGGWIWRGYLNDASSTQKAKTSVPVATPSTSTTGTSSTTTSDNTTPATATTSAMDWTPYIPKYDLQPADINLMKQFPNTVYDEGVEDAANQFLGRDAQYILESNNDSEEQQKFSTLLTADGVTFKDFRVITFVVKDPDSNAEVTQALANAGYDLATRLQYDKGWRIGGGIEPIDSYNEKAVDGQSIVILVEE